MGKYTANKDNVLHVRLSDEDYSYIKETSDAMGLKMSQLVRALIQTSLSYARGVSRGLRDGNEKNDK